MYTSATMGILPIEKKNSYFLGSITQTLETLLPYNIVKLDKVANLAGLSPRSLQKSLAKRFYLFRFT